VSEKQRLIINGTSFYRNNQKQERKQVNMIIFGAPGSGKGTYASRLQSKLGVDVIAIGDIFREIMKEETSLGKKVKGYVEKGLLVPDDVVVDVLKKRLAKVPRGKGFILDGYPRTVEQARALEKMVKIDVIVQLSVPEWIIIERLSTRRLCKNCGEVYNIRYLKPKVDMVCDKCSGPLYQRLDDTAEVIKDRIRVYERQTEPLLQCFEERKVPVVKFECDKLEMSPEVGVEKILKGLKRLKLV
jgi:adenylate kinase